MNTVVDGLEPLMRALDLHSLRIIQAINNTGSITGAALELGYSQPAITQHLQRLETRIGMNVLARSGRTIRLTDVGVLLARHAAGINASLVAVASEISELAGLHAGTIRIAAFPDASTTLVAELLGNIERQFPGITARFIEAEPAEALRLVRDGAADIALTYEYILTGSAVVQSRPDDGVRSRFLFSDELVAAIPASHPAAVLASVDFADLGDTRWVANSSMAENLLPSLGRKHGFTPQIHYSTESTSTALAFVSHDLACTLVPQLALSGLQVPADVALRPFSPNLRRRVSATTLIDAEGIPSVSIALQLLARMSGAKWMSGSAAQTCAPFKRRNGNSLHSRFSAPPFSQPISFTARTAILAKSPRTTALGTTLRTVAAASTLALLAGCAAPADGGGAAPSSDASIEMVTVALPGSLSNLSVGQEDGILNYYIASITQEGLVALDADGQLQPSLAESWSQPNPLTYVYELRQDARFQDGTPVTAEDVIFSLQKTMDDTVSPANAYHFAGVESVVKSGQHEVTITLAAPDPTFAKNMSPGGGAFITSQAFWEAADGKIGTSSTLLLGSGPYKITEFVPDSHVSFARVDTWWGTEPKVKSINVEFIPDESTRLLAAQSGEIDMAFNVPLAQANQWESIEQMDVKYASDLSYVGMYFNTALAPFDDVKVREAFAHSIDRSAVVDKLLHGRGEVATAIATPESLREVYTPKEARKLLGTIPQYNFDLKAAKKALAASGYPDGFETEILYPSTGPQLGTAAQSLAENLGKIGVKLNVREVPIEEWLASLDAGSEYGVGLMWFFSTLGDPAQVSSYMLGDENISNYNNPAVTSLMTQASAEVDPAARIDLLVQAETLQATDVINVPLWWGQSATAFSKKLGMNDYSSFAFLSSWPASFYRAG